MTAVREDDAQTQRRARDAGRALAETGAAFDGLKAALIQELLDSPPDGQAMRERLYLAIQMLDRVRRALEVAVAAGEMADYRAVLAAEGVG